MRILWGFLSLYSFAESSVKSLLDLWQRFVKGYTAVFRPNYYLFFEGSSAAYPYYSVNHWATGSAAPDLMYCADKKLFFPWIPRNPDVPAEGMDFSDVFVEERYRPLAVLSLEVVDAEGRVAYDLTDFIETVRYVALDGFKAPALEHVLAAWTLSSGIVPDATRFTLRYIDSDGNLFPQESETDGSGSGETTEAPETESESKESEQTEESKEDSDEKPADATTADEKPAESVASETSTTAVISGEAVTTEDTTAAQT